MRQAAPYVIRQVDNRHERLVYAGGPHQGLHALLHLWPHIRQLVLQVHPRPHIRCTSGLTSAAVASLLHLWPHIRQLALQVPEP